MSRTYTTLGLISWFLLIGMAIPTGLYAAQYFEYRYFPVMAWFSVNETVRTPSRVYITGMMRKLRDNCETIGLSAQGPNGSVLTLKTLDSGTPDKMISRRVGEQMWGPWEISSVAGDVPSDISLYVQHRCHFLWKQTTNLTSLPKNQAQYLVRNK